MRRGLARYWRIYKVFFATALRRETEFRANFIAKILQNLIWTVFFVLFLLVIYSNTDDVAGWSFPEAIVLAGTIFLAESICSALFTSLNEIPEHVRKGSLDYVVTKPVDSQFWVSTRRFNFDQIGTISAAAISLVIGLNQGKIAPSLLDFVGYFFLVGVSIVLIYSLTLTLVTMGIYFMRVDNIVVLRESMTWVARYPNDIYSLYLQRFFLVVVPLAFFATVPARQLTQGVNWMDCLGGLAWCLVAFLGSRAFWMRAQRSYASASS